MTNRLEIALALAGKGFHVFPVAPMTKIPDIDGWQRKATTDSDRIRAWWTCPVTGLPQNRNIGICTTRFATDRALVVVDVDNKQGKCGDDTLLELELAGREFPATLEGQTPTGGRHLIYLADKPVNQHKPGFLGEGLDIRSHGGYIVAAGSEVTEGTYGLAPGTLRTAPNWLIARLGPPPASRMRTKVPTAVEEGDWAHERARELLAGAGEVAEGERNATAYRLACQLRDLGLIEPTVQGLLDEWNITACAPPLDTVEIERTAESCFRSAQNPAGSAHPAAEFKPAADETAQNPIRTLNQEFAFVVAGGGHHILWETTDDKNRFKLEHLSEQTFHRLHASKTLMVGKREEPLTKVWMNSQQRRSYQGLVFSPGKPPLPEYYNLWRGFAVEPAESADQISKKGRQAVEMWHEHARENICRGDEGLYQWLINFFAHMIQYPHEKPLVALVLRGGEGVGKSAPLDRIGSLLGTHYMATANRRYLVGNFNAHLERLLFFVLEEAYWAGDKAVEGVMKDLVTGQAHVIEQKGKEPYLVDNLARIAIVGNEEWVVPAASDARRWAVFDVDNNRKQDHKFFGAMREGIDCSDGGRFLLRQLLDFDVDRSKVHQAPATRGLAAQKVASLDVVAEWWHTSLTEGTIDGAEFEGWPETVKTTRLFSAFQHHARGSGIRARLPNQLSFGHKLAALAPSVQRKRIRSGEQLYWAYALPEIQQARDEFETFLGQRVGWPGDDLFA